MHGCTTKGMAALRRVERTGKQTANPISVAKAENTCQSIAAGGSAAFCFDDCICEAALPLRTYCRAALPPACTHSGIAASMHSQRPCRQHATTFVTLHDLSKPVLCNAFVELICATAYTTCGSAAATSYVIHIHILYLYQQHFCSSKVAWIAIGTGWGRWAAQWQRQVLEELQETR
jgi:hypothetical protein